MTLLPKQLATLLVMILGGAACAYTAISAEPERMPNILYIMVDDMGYGDLGVTSSRKDSYTYYIDKLASEGILLRNGYASAAICSPTRVALMTGNYRERLVVGLPEPISPGVPADIGLPFGISTLPSVFRDRGYETYLLGKWHLGAPPEHNPLEHGYDHFYGIHKGSADHFHHQMEPDAVPNQIDDGLFRDRELVDEPGYLTRLLTDETIKVINESTPDNPFMISLHYTTPHWPWEGPYDEEFSAEMDTVRELVEHNNGTISKFQEMMQYTDYSVGRILNALQKKGIDEDTIVVFTSDNGGERFSDTWPYTGYKSQLLEGGIRAPIIMRWPGQIDAGHVSEQVMVSMDFLPTLVAATGQPVDDSQFDGMNLMPVILGDEPVRERTIFWRFENGDQAAVRQGDWKYFRADGQEWLFDVEKGPHERNQLADDYPDKFEELKSLWESWNSEMEPYREWNPSDRVDHTFP